MNNIELARVVGCSLQQCLDRGQSYKVHYQILRHIRGTGFVIPALAKVKDGDDAGTTIVPYYDEIRGIEAAGQGDTGFMGATVLEPQRGFHTDPVAVLDFASLYPSIMMAHNLSHDTLLKSEEHARELGVAYTESPNGYFFVTSASVVYRSRARPPCAQTMRRLLPLLATAAALDSLSCNDLNVAFVDSGCQNSCSSATCLYTLPACAAAAAGHVCHDGTNVVVKGLLDKVDLATAGSVVFKANIHFDTNNAYDIGNAEFKARDIYEAE